MATIGLDRLYYAKITEDTNGDETWRSPNTGQGYERRAKCRAY